MKAGKLRLYTGTINKGGASVFEFTGVKLVHRSIKADKSDYVVHQSTGAIMFTLPIGSDRAKALDFLAKNVNTLLEFNREPTSYEIVEYKKEVKVKIEDLPPKYPPMYKEPSYSDGCANRFKKKRTFDMRYIKW